MLVSVGHTQCVTVCITNVVVEVSHVPEENGRAALRSLPSLTLCALSTNKMYRSELTLYETLSLGCLVCGHRL